MLQNNLDSRSNLGGQNSYKYRDAVIFMQLGFPLAQGIPLLDSHLFFNNHELPLTARCGREVGGGSNPLVHGHVGKWLAQNAIMDGPRP